MYRSVETLPAQLKKICGKCYMDQNWSSIEISLLKIRLILFYADSIIRADADIQNGPREKVCQWGRFIGKIMQLEIVRSG